jgi:hypothetical protein
MADQRNAIYRLRFIQQTNRFVTGDVPGGAKALIVFSTRERAEEFLIGRNAGERCEIQELNGVEAAEWFQDSLRRGIAAEVVCDPPISNEPAYFRAVPIFSFLIESSGFEFDRPEDRYWDHRDD